MALYTPSIGLVYEVDGFLIIDTIFLAQDIKVFFNEHQAAGADAEMVMVLESILSSPPLMLTSTFLSSAFTCLRLRCQKHTVGKGRLRYKRLEDLLLAI